MKNSNWTIYYNPKCGTCRNTLALLEKKGIKPTIVEYLKNPPTLKELEAISKKLRGPATEMVRSKEPVYGELKFSESTPINTQLKAIVDYPVLLQRPLVVNDRSAIVARPPEKVLELF